MTKHLLKSEITSGKSLKITGSKSESNRLLLLQALYPNITIENLSNSDDSQLMQKALAGDSDIIDIHHAGTAMRFLTAYYSIQEGRQIELTGSSRMKERPIEVLVEALKSLGADITYKENEGFPPLRINGTTFSKSEVELTANVSSQYISALLLIAPSLKNGLHLSLKGQLTSVPYIKMTLRLLEDIGVQTKFEGNEIWIDHLNDIGQSKTMVVESDWSSASYYYSIIALSPVGTQLKLSSYKKDSLQGDSVLSELYKVFGVVTTFSNHNIELQKTSEARLDEMVKFNLINSPDIAQTIAVTAFGLGLQCELTGLHTLKIKETDRLVALKTELEKLGAAITIDENSLRLGKSNSEVPNVAIDTYKDHRMAMAFAPLALVRDISINEAEVVSKSYPTFWEDLETLGIIVK
ncbi:3-phosphoshikimate 1-carboxyvinyltransferase [Winogradskyella maritima]|uniref:3-phosphoshikimate 1-carboxyvinyltransferase n=1 Tax=Winogradskyella maritima TaxID=1517766 RepID=A0ABV8AM44_9FLAO|nr:3-phosphoshikimate 1-carboxyvinyltransferase [Winogradskyella maritima]MDO1502575.1 3-phosphoshikimate 1-carboxyvinyltransferase [Winogradskyella maritima]